MQLAKAQDSGLSASEYNLKLARIYATCKFISWPDESEKAPFVISVVAPDPFSDGLEKLSERMLKDRPIVTKTIRTINDFTGCHLLFIPNGADPVLAEQILKKIVDQPVLVWFDQPEAHLTSKASFTFLRQEEKLIIEANQSELHRRGLRADGQLMSLNIVRTVKSQK